MINPVFLWRLEITTPGAARDGISAVFDSHCMAVTIFETVEDSDDWRIEGFCGAEPDRTGIEHAIAKACKQAGASPLTALRCELEPPRDWLAENMAAFPPTRVGRFFIHGSDFVTTPPASSIPIRLDPGTAFGSGEHASTAGCLMMIEALAKKHQFTRLLDMGCGSGILSIAMAKVWRVPVVSSDIDDEAARVTRFNAGRNGVAPLIRAVCGPGYGSRAVSSARPYDLIVANILARPLIAMAGDLARHLRPAAEGGGMAILSGLLERDGRRVLAAHQAHGLRLADWRVRNGWLTLTLQR
jgi:ribosomal protein L11 methyltransferase